MLADMAYAPSLDRLEPDLPPESWASGYTLEGGGRSITTVAPLDRLVVREISSLCLPEDERIQIADIRRDGISVVGTVRLPSAVNRI
ncbi:hypothetical protein C6369_001535 [Rhodococcus rhodochrous]|nr:hypothetical protein C6369_001535 [Rhodococcus rhodochrous]